MLFPDEVRPPDVVGDLPDHADVPERERAAATQLIESLSTHWDPDRYHDTYRERVIELIEHKAEGEQVVLEQRQAPQPQVVDLMAALEASLAVARKGRGADARPASGGGDVGGQHRDWTRERLYHEAQCCGMPGRSSMNKDELRPAA